MMSRTKEAGRARPFRILDRRRTEVLFAIPKRPILISRRQLEADRLREFDLDQIGPAPFVRQKLVAIRRYGLASGIPAPP